MANNDEALKRAKEIGEPMLENALYGKDKINLPFKVICVYPSGEKEDMLQHVDRYVDDGTDDYEIKIDLKDVEDENMNTGNYSLGKNCVDYYRRHAKQQSRAYFAFWLNDGKTRLKSFLLASMKDVLGKCRIFGGEFALVSLSEIRQNCSCYVIHDDLA